MDKLQMDTLQANLSKLQKEVEALDTTAMSKRVDSIFAALQAAQIIAVTPTVAPIGDEIARGAGFKDQHGQDPNLPEPTSAVPGAQPPQMPPDTSPLTPDNSASAATPPMQPDAGPPATLGPNTGMDTQTPADNVPAPVDPLTQGQPS